MSFRTLFNILILLGLTAILTCIPDGQLKTNFDVKPVALMDGWQIATPEEARLDSAKVMEAFQMIWDENEYYNAKSLIVVRFGKLVFENYCRDTADRTLKAHIQSVTKSVTSLTFGIARDQGYFPNLDTLLYDIMPEKFDTSSLKRRITLHHLLTMKSGILFDNDVFSDEMISKKPKDPVQYILAKPMYAAPGDSFYYRDCDPQLISNVFKRVTGRNLDELARDSIFTPLGITDYLWEKNSDSVTFGPYGLFLKPRDLAKIGKLVLQQGRWENRQLISHDWILISTAFQTEVPGPEGFRYGYYWWVVPEVSGITAWGHGGQFIFILPQYEMVIVMTSMPSVNDDKVGTTLPKFLPIVKKIIEAVIP
jgi:CubicO group peptidase (beta-lactamase class C family)